MSFSCFRMPRVRRLRAWLIPAILIFLAAPLSIASAAEVAGRVLIKLSETGAAALQGGRLDVPIPVGGETRSPRWSPLFQTVKGPLSRYLLLTYRADRGATGADNLPWLEALRRSDLIEDAESDRVLAMSAFPADPYFLGDGGLPRQFHLYNPDSLSVEAVRSWPFVPANSGVVVAILDTGVDWQHPDLGGANPPDTGVFWTNAAERNGTPGVDDDNNGFVDDEIGWDFVEISEAGGLPQGWEPAVEEDADVPDNDPDDRSGHGTQVAGFVAAIRGNGEGIAPGAPGVRLMPLRVGWHSADGNPRVFMSFCARALEYAALNGARVANCSWESQNQLGLGEALDLAVTTMDMVVVGAAGNSGSSSTGVAYLASRSDCLGVAGILKDGSKALFSNYGTYVDIAGFYQGMPSTFFDESQELSTYQVHPQGGTSFSAPQAAALAALLRAVDPGADAATVISTIRATGQDLSLTEPTYADRLGGGLLDYAAAVQTLGGGWDTVRVAGGLTPSPAEDGSVFFLGPAAAEALAAGTGDPAPGWEAGQSIQGAAGAFFPLAAFWSGTANPPVFIFGDDGSLEAFEFPGTPALGWPVPLPAGSGQPVAGAGSASREAEFIPLGNDVLELNLSGSGLDSTRLGLPLSSLCLSETAPDSSVLFAGVDTAGSLYVWSADPAGTSPPGTVEVGPVSAGPVLGEFEGPGMGVAVVAVPDSTFPSLQHLVFVDRFGMVSSDIPFTAGFIEFLSLAGFNDQTRLVAVAVDGSGGVHITGPNDGFVSTLSAGGPLAGEVLCADITGDYQSELIALRTDGTLIAWDMTLSVVPGFPRDFPVGFDQPPAVVDDGGRRYLVSTDTSGVTWSLPVSVSGLPKPWPVSRGNSGRTAFLGHARGTPVESGVSLTWSGDGDVCWSGLEAAAYARFRLRGEEGGVLWQGTGPESHCVSASREETPGVVVLEGLTRSGDWIELARVRRQFPIAFRLAAPHPNPFRAQTRVDWSGAKGPVALRIYDVRGRLVREERAGARGSFFWQGTDARGAAVSPGIYFLRLDDGNSVAVRRVLKIG